LTEDLKTRDEYSPVRAATHVGWGAVALSLLFAVLVLLPVPLADKFYMIGFGICPQRISHSYFFGGTRLAGESELRSALPLVNAAAPAQPTKLPVEARMYGMFAGFLLTWGYAWLIGRGRSAVMPKPVVLALYVAFVAVMGLDGINATLRDLHAEGLPLPFAYEPRLDLRFFTGWLCGIALAGIILPVVNYSLWKNAQPRAMFEQARDLIPLLFLGLGILALLTTGSGLFYYPLAVLAPVGILAILSALNLVLVITLRGRERVAANWVEALDPLALALCLALLELGLLSLLRYAAFGLTELA